MIIHFIEVWALLIVTFVLGGAIGALAYELLAQSGSASAQAVIVDDVGDIVDGVKRRLGITPAWREYRHIPVHPEPELFQPPGETELAEAIAAELENMEYPPDTGHGPPIDYRDEEPEPHYAPEFEREFELDHQPEPEPDYLPDREPDPKPLMTVSEERAHPVVTLADLDAKRPPGLDDPRQGIPDDLQKIRGIGKKNEKLLNQLGIYHFGQIAAWTPAEILWIGQYISFPDRIVRDDWIGQAVILASGGDTGVTKSASRRRNRRRKNAERNRDEGGDPSGEV